jgi:single-strand DNA-binding protein
MSFNKITLVGYLGRDPELRYTPQGTALCKMSIATTERRKNVAGESEEHTTWFRVTVWARQAELANEYLAKGRQVYVEGRLRIEEYTDREGQKRFSAEVNATDIQFLGQRVEHPNPAATEEVASEEKVKPAEPKSSSKPSKSKRSSAEELVSIEEDDIPF